MSAALGPLRIPAFRRLTGAYALNRLGDMVALIAMAIVVWDRTRSVWATTALFAALELVPGLLAPALTARLDRVPVARVLGVLYAVEAAIFCVLATLTHAFSLGPFLALVAVDGVLAVVTRAICRGAVAALLEPAGQLREGNALLNLAVSPTLALGAAFGAGLVATLGADAALLVNAGTFAAGAAAAGTARGLPRHCSAEDGEPGHWRERLRDALGYLRGHPLVTALLLGQGAATAFFAMTEPIEVVYTRDSLGAGPGGYGALVAAWGAGVILGSVVYTCAARRSLAAALALSTLLQGAALVALAAAPGIDVACAIAVVGGTANGAQGAALITALQEATDIAYQVRVMSFFEALAAVAPGIGYLLGGAIAASAGGRLAFVVAGAGVFVVAGTVTLARPWRSRVAEGANMPRPLPLSPDRGALGATEGAHMPRSHM